MAGRLGELLGAGGHHAAGEVPVRVGVRRLDPRISRRTPWTCRQNRRDACGRLASELHRIGREYSERFRLRHVSDVSHGEVEHVAIRRDGQAAGDRPAGAQPARDVHRLLLAESRRARSGEPRDDIPHARRRDRFDSAQSVEVRGDHSRQRDSQPLDRRIASHVLDGRHGDDRVRRRRGFVRRAPKLPEQSDDDRRRKPGQNPRPATPRDGVPRRRRAAPTRHLCFRGDRRRRRDAWRRRRDRRLLRRESLRFQTRDRSRGRRRARRCVEPSLGDGDGSLRLSRALESCDASLARFDESSLQLGAFATGPVVELRRVGDVDGVEEPAAIERDGARVIPRLERRGELNRVDLDASVVGQRDVITPGSERIRAEHAAQPRERVRQRVTRASLILTAPEHFDKGIPSDRLGGQRDHGQHGEMPRPNLGERLGLTIYDGEREAPQSLKPEVTAHQRVDMVRSRGRRRPNIAPRSRARASPQPVPISHETHPEYSPKCPDPATFGEPSSRVGRAIAIAMLLASVAPLAAGAQGLIDRAKQKIQDRVNNAEDSLTDAALDKATGAITCAATNTQCIHKALGAGKTVKVVDKNGKQVSAADSAKAVNAAGGVPASTQSASATSSGSAATTASAPAFDDVVLVNYDFVPGDRVIFAEDFAKDNIGDFPKRLELRRGNFEVAKWQGQQYLRTNSGGVVVYSAAGSSAVALHLRGGLQRLQRLEPGGELCRSRRGRQPRGSLVRAWQRAARPAPA